MSLIFESEQCQKYVTFIQIYSDQLRDLQGNNTNLLNELNLNY